MREAEVVDHFGRWLEAKGWEVDLEIDWVDVTATRGARTLLAEAKGSTAAMGLDVDTAYGQLLRRMTDNPSTAYAIVVPSAATRAALRVPDHVLTTLRLSVFSVAKDGTVQLEAGDGV
jgi:hypothetical protein